MAIKKTYPQKVFTEPIPPIPYHATLRHSFFNPSATLLFTYLEIHHPAHIDPQDPLGRLSEAPILVTIGEITNVLQVSGGTVRLLLAGMCSRFPAEEEMFRAKRAGRQFLVPEHSLNSQIKAYAYCGFVPENPDSPFAIYRNHSHIAAILRNAALLPANLPSSSNLNERDFNPELYATQLKAKGLTEILASANANWSGDRRKTRYVRARAAVASGAAPASILKVKRKHAYGRWTPEARAAHSAKMKEYCAIGRLRPGIRKGSMDNMPQGPGTP